MSQNLAQVAHRRIKGLLAEQYAEHAHTMNRLIILSRRVNESLINVKKNVRACHTEIPLTYKVTMSADERCY